MPELITRLLPISKNSANPETRTAQVTWTTGARVRRRDWDGEYFEELSLAPDAVRLDRLNSGAPLLNTHQGYDVSNVLGVVESARIKDGVGIATIRFSERPEVDGIFRDVLSGVIRNVSVGYVVHSWSESRDGTSLIRTATDWEPYEISLVPVPADAGAGVRSNPKGTAIMPEDTTLETTANENVDNQRAPARIPTGRAQQNRIRQLRDIANAAQLGADIALEWAERGATPDEARTEALQMLADRSDQFNPRPPSHRDHNDPQVRLRAMGDALAARYLPVSPDDFARHFVHMSLLDMARDICRSNGLNVSHMAPARVIERALHATSDFPELLANVANKGLLMAYQAAESGLKRVSRQTTAPDFRARKRIRLGEMPQLKKVDEHGEYTSGTLGEQAESYSVATYGRIFGITRQALINDDLGGFVDLSSAFGRAAANTEAQLLVDLLISNPAMSDGVAVFHADHGNLAGTGAAISVTSLGSARAAMRLQKGIDGVTILNISPRYLVVPAALETLAEQTVTVIQATKTSDVNPFPGKLEVVPEPRLDANSATAWYLFAASGAAESIEYAYLQDSLGPEILTRQGFEVDGLEVKARLDFGCGFVDWRGAYKNAGA